MVANVVLRAALPSDGLAIESVLSASYSELLKGAYSESLLAVALPALTTANPALLASGTFYLAENASGRLVGCGGWTHQKPGTSEMEEGIAHIRHFAIHPNWSGRGIGRSIYNHCEGQAREARVKIFDCYSTLNAQPFYAALGFKTISANEVMLRGTIKFPTVLMRRSI
jgi:N-acetylglutamate synthase-like GNAT family acetyltransferase